MNANAGSGTAAAGLIIADADQRILAADRIFLQAIGCPAGDVEGRSVAEVLRVGLGALDRLPIEPGAPGHSGRFRVSSADGRGRARLLCVSYAHVRLEGDPRGAVMLTVEDLTPQ